MICCASLLLILGWVGYRQTQRPSQYAALQVGLALGLWGGGLAALAYITLIGVLLAIGAMVFVDQQSFCLGGAGAVVAVPAAWVAERWTQRTMLVSALALLMIATAVLQLRRAGISQPQPAAMQLGAGLSWLTVSVVDHQGFGLYAPVYGGWIADAAIHLPGAALAAMCLMKAGGQPLTRSFIPRRPAAAAATRPRPAADNAARSRRA